MRIGPYEALRLLGRGGMSEVWESVDSRTGARLALKSYSFDKDDPDVRRRFEREGQMLARFAHPRIVRVRDFGTDEATGRPYFVMDLVLNPHGEVQSLADLPDGAADDAMVGRWYDDLRLALEYIHALGVVHRDLKLQNVLVGPDGHAVLADFGISRVFGTDQTGADPVQTVLRLRDGKRPVMGSVGYLAPELEMGVAATPQSDYYALGVLVYRLLTGMWCDARTDLRGMLETYEPAWGRIVPKLLHANPQGRECLSYAKETDADRIRREAETDAALQCEERRTRVLRRLAVAAFAAAVLALAAGGIFVWQAHVARADLQKSVDHAGDRRAMLSFDALFPIPPQARADEIVAANGTVEMPSRGQFDASRIDALVLTHSVLSALQTGAITVEKAVDEFQRLIALLESDEADAVFDGLVVDSIYQQVGDNDSLRMLLVNAVEKLRTLPDRSVPFL